MMTMMNVRTDGQIEKKTMTAFAVPERTITKTEWNNLYDST